MALEINVDSTIWLVWSKCRIAIMIVKCELSVRFIIEMVCENLNEINFKFK